MAGMTYSSPEGVERILRALGKALRATHRIGEIEAQVGRSRGYFSKVTAGKWRISLDVLLETLEILELDPATFFANALADPGEDPERTAAIVRGPSNFADLPRGPLRPPVDPWRR